jgi:phage/plasmid-like protein (TIGR03299 family)
MSHELDFSKGFAAIATGAGTEMPWHGFVNDYLTDEDTPETAVKKGGIDFTVKKAPVNFIAELDNGEEKAEAFDNKAVLYRSDTGAALSVMSDSHYVPAQPVELVAGLYELVKGSGFKLDCIMALKGGKVISALARRECEPGQLGEDIHLPYVGILTSFDGTFARQASMTAIRRVCMNTVRFSLSESKDTTAKQRNSREFTIEKANDLFDKLGEFDAGFANYMEVMRALTSVKMTDDKLIRFFSKLYAPDAFSDADKWTKSAMDFDAVSTNKKNVIADLLEFTKDSPGSNLPSADGTLYGAFNAVTFYQDHEARTKGGKRWESASIGNGARIKENALELAQSLVS